MSKPKTSKATTTVSDISAFLADNATDKTAKKKSDTPELDGVSETLVDQVYQAYVEQKDAEANFKSLEGQLLEAVGPKYEKAAKSGDFSKTFNIAGAQTAGVQVSYKDQFKNIPLDKEKALRANLGEKYDTYFYQKREISMVDTTDDSIRALLAVFKEVNDLRAKDGRPPADFKKMFKIDVSIGTKEDMDRRQFDLPGDVRLALAQYKASTKIRKDD